MGKSIISMVIFNSYVKLPEGTQYVISILHWEFLFDHCQSESRMSQDGWTLLESKACGTTWDQMGLFLFRILIHTLCWLCQSHHFKPNGEWFLIPKKLRLLPTNRANSCDMAGWWFLFVSIPIWNDYIITTEERTFFKMGDLKTNCAVPRYGIFAK